MGITGVVLLMWINNIKYAHHQAVRWCSVCTCSSTSVCLLWLQRACRWWRHWSPGRPGCRGWTVYTAEEVSSLANRLQETISFIRSELMNYKISSLVLVLLLSHCFCCLFFFIPIDHLFIHQTVFNHLQGALKKHIAYLCPWQEARSGHPRPPRLLWTSAV